MAEDRAPGWVVPVMRAGYGARGVVYALVGGLAVLAAWHGRHAEGTASALQSLKDRDWGMAALALIAIGMFCYAAWRAIDSVMDLEEYGNDLRGLISRGGLMTTGLIHALVGVYVLALLAGSAAASGDGEGAESLTRMVMVQPFGRYLVGVAGLCTMGAGAYYAHKGWSGAFREKLHLTEVSRRLNGVMAFGLYAHAVVVALIGGFLFWAAWTYDPSQAGGLSQAFGTIRQAAFGQVMLGIVALGLVAFAVFCFVNAVYRIVPARVDADSTRTLAHAVREKAAEARAAAR